MDNRYIASAILILSFAANLLVLLAEPLVPYTDSPYYLMQIEHVLSHGDLAFPDSPISFYYASVFAWFLGSINGFKVAISLASALCLMPVYLIISRIFGEKEALFTILLISISPAHYIIGMSLLKNTVGMMLALCSLWFLVNRQNNIALLLALLTSLTSPLSLAFLAAMTLGISLYYSHDTSYISLVMVMCILMGVYKLSYYTAQSEPISGFGFLQLYSMMILPAVFGIFNTMRHETPTHIKMGLGFFIVPMLIIIFLSFPIAFGSDIAGRFLLMLHVPLCIVAAIGVIRLMPMVPIGAVIISGTALLCYMQITPPNSMITMDEFDYLKSLNKEGVTLEGVAIGNAKNWMEYIGFKTTLYGDGTHIIYCNPYYDGRNNGMCELMTRKKGRIEKGTYGSFLNDSQRFTIVSKDDS